MKQENDSNSIEIVDYSLEEARAALDEMIEATLQEFDSACDKIDAELEQKG